MALVTPSTIINVKRTTNMNEIDNEITQEALENIKTKRKDQERESFSCKLQ